MSLSHLANAASFSSLTVESLKGQTVLKQGSRTLTIPKEKTALNWQEGLFQVGKLGLLKIEDLDSGSWSFLESSQVEILNSAAEIQDNPFKRNVKLRQGVIRFKRTREMPQKTKNYVVLLTPEVKVTPQENADVVVQRQLDPTTKLFITKIYVLNGSVSLLIDPTILKSKSVNKDIPLKPGVQFKITQKGTILPLVRSDGKELDQILDAILKDKSIISNLKVRATKLHVYTLEQQQQK